MTFATCKGKTYQLLFSIHINSHLPRCIATNGRKVAHVSRSARRPPRSHVTLKRGIVFTLYAAAQHFWHSTGFHGALITLSPLSPFGPTGPSCPLSPYERSAASALHTLLQKKKLKVEMLEYKPPCTYRNPPFSSGPIGPWLSRGPSLSLHTTHTWQIIKDASCEGKSKLRCELTLSPGGPLGPGGPSSPCRKTENAVAGVSSSKWKPSSVVMIVVLGKSPSPVPWAQACQETRLLHARPWAPEQAS